MTTAYLLNYDTYALNLPFPAQFLPIYGFEVGDDAPLSTDKRKRKRQIRRRNKLRLERFEEEELLLMMEMLRDD